jgi:hypothetical protein
MYPREKAEGLAILIALVCAVAGAYLQAWRGNRPAFRRGASWTIAAVFKVAGLWGLVAYAIPALEDFGISEVPLWQAVVGNLIAWVIFCLLPWGIAINFTMIALRRSSSR